jgi:hypothetical protein
MAHDGMPIRRERHDRSVVVLSGDVMALEPMTEAVLDAQHVRQCARERTRVAFTAAWCPAPHMAGSKHAPARLEGGFTSERHSSPESLR